MTYTLCFADQPIHSSRNPIEVHNAALAIGLAVRAWGCLFTLVPGATIKKAYRYD